MNEKKIVIIGAGPAGLSASIQLAEMGFSSTIIDENQRIGGAIFKQPEKGFENSIFYNEKTYVRAKKLFNDFNQYSSLIDLELECEVLGNFPQTNELAVLQNGKVRNITIESLLVSTGCYERAQPFPGWTLSGIMSVGGIQLQVKSGNVKPGQRVALIGTGPLLMVAAKQLHMAGLTVVAVVEAGKRKDILNKSLDLLSNTKLLREGVSYKNYLKKHKIPYYYGHGVVKAVGNLQVEKLMIAPYDDQWNPIREKAFTLEVDSVGIQYGYVPRIQLTQMFSCKHSYDKNRGGYFPLIDEWHRTSIKNIYSAGDTNGIYGSEVAILSGKIAALGYLIDTGKISLIEAEKLAAPIKKEMNKLKKFQRSLDQFSELRAGLMTLPEADTIICRCEHINKETIDQAIKAGVKDMTALKIQTRVGMGNCQGKMCGSYCQEYLSHKTNLSAESVGLLNPRFPLAPISFESITLSET